MKVGQRPEFWTKLLTQFSHKSWAKPPACTSGQQKSSTLGLYMKVVQILYIFGLYMKVGQRLYYTQLALKQDKASTLILYMKVGQSHHAQDKATALSLYIKAVFLACHKSRTASTRAKLGQRLHVCT